MAIERWLPRLHDEITVSAGALRVRGTVSRWDPAVAVLERAAAPLALVPGQRVAARWQVDDRELEGSAVVEEVTARAWTVRLDGPVGPADFTHRRDARHRFEAQVTVTQAFAGSLAPPAVRGRTLDVSAGGMRLALDPGAVQPGDVLEVVLEHEGRTERLIAYVVWERSAAAGGRAAGLRFRDEVRLGSPLPV